MEGGRDDIDKPLDIEILKLLIMKMNQIVYEYFFQILNLLMPALITLPTNYHGDNLITLLCARLNFVDLRQRGDHLVLKHVLTNGRLRA